MKKILLCLFSNKIYSVLWAYAKCVSSHHYLKNLSWFFSFFLKVLCLDAWSHGLDFLSDPNCKLEDKAEDGEVLDCKKRPDEGEELEEEAVHSCDSCLQVFESLSDITEHKINQCQLTGKQYLSLRGFLHCSISASYFLFLISLFLSQLFYSCSWMLRWDFL